MDKKKVLVLIAAVIFVLALLFCAVMFTHGGGDILEIVKDGEVLYEIDVSSLTEEREITVDGGDGMNVIHVSPDGVYMSFADCPDQVCVRTGDILGKAVPIVCLPHKLVVRWRTAGGADAVLQ